MEQKQSNIKQFLDDDGRITQFPRKHSSSLQVLEYLVTKFQKGHLYNEKQVNEICNHWHTFNDYFVLRRSLVDEGFLKREINGSSYWVNEDRIVEELQ